MGYSVPDLYLGDGETGEVKFLAHNAGWPAWSWDGRSIYYLSGRIEGDLVRYDLYRAEPTLANPELVVLNVGDAGTQPAVSELADGRFVLLDQGYQPAIWDQGKMTTIADLIGLGRNSRQGCRLLPCARWPQSGGFGARCPGHPDRSGNSSGRSSTERPDPFPRQRGMVC